MTIQLEIYFADLIAFVEYKEQLWALMPKTCGKGKHFPQLIFWESLVDKDKTTVNYEINAELAMVPLEGFDLKIPNILGNSLDRKMAHVDPVPSGNDNHWNWVVPMSEMVKSHGGNVKQEVFDLNPDAFLASRLSFPSGKFRTHHFCSGTWLGINNRFIHAYEFKKCIEVKENGKEKEICLEKADFPIQAMANCVKGDFGINSSNTSFLFTPFDKNQPSGQLVLKPLFENRIEVIIGNLGSQINLSDNPVNENLEHFEYFYDLLENWTAPRFTPRRATWSTHRVPEGRSTIQGNWPPSLIGNNNSRVGQVLNGGLRIQSVMQDLESCPQVRLEPPAPTEG